MTEKKYTLFTLAMTGVLSYMISDITHEVIGHGGTCLIIGNRINLLTNVYFKSSPGNFIVDIGGPIANLIFGGLAFILLKKTTLPKLLLLQVTAYNLFWFSGTILHSAISKTGDWTFAIKEISSGFFEKCILIAASLLFYVLFIRILNSYLAGTFNVSQRNALRKQDIIYSFFFAALAAFTSGLFFKSDRMHSAFECLLEMAASLPVLFLRQSVTTNLTNDKYVNNNFFNFSVCILFIAFCLTLGKGIAA
jgi:hypothetical protein